MNIYSAKRYPLSSTTTLKRIIGSLYPISIGEQTYNKSNYGIITLYTLDGKQCTTSPITFEGRGEILTLSQNVSGYNNEYGLTRLIYTDETLDTTYFEELPTTTISGRFKFRETFTTIPASLAGGIIDVNVSILDKNFIALTFPVGRNDSNWFYTNKNSRYAPDRIGTSEKNYLTEYTTIGGYATSPNRLEAPTDYVGMFSTDSISKTFIEDYWGAVWDFGDIPQIVPQVFADWVLANSDPVYPYTYTVKSQNGVSVLSEISEIPAIVSATLLSFGNQKTLTLTGVNEREYTMTWESETPEGYSFLGLSNSPNSARVILAVNAESIVNWNEDFVLYESYGKYRPPTTTFDIELYQNSAEVNRVDKGNHLVGVGTLSGALREECSLLTPSIVYQSSSVPNFNYVYIPIFNRYYFVTSHSSVSKDVWRMELNCDVLMSYKDEIRLLQGVISRQELDFNPMLVDSDLPTQDNPEVTVINIPSNVFKSHTNVSDNFYNFVLTVIG